MCELSLIVLAAGDSTRMQMDAKKQWLRIGHDPLWKFVADELKTKYKFSKIIVVANANELEYMRNFSDEFDYVNGGKTRQHSLKNALESIESEYVLVHDVARVKISSNLLNSIINENEAGKFDCISPYLGVNDTTYLNEKIISRDEIKLIQTPQLSKTNLLKKALESSEVFTDDSMAVASVGGKLGFVKGEKEAFKITHKEDLKKINLAPPSKDIFVGNGFDVHKFGSGDGIYLCGIKVPCEHSLIAHSDGDVALHALIDAILGACGLGDIGELYPDNDDKFRDISSVFLLENVINSVKSFGYEVVNADITIMVQTPKLGVYKKEMAKKVSQILGINRVNVKATTTEKLGFIGRKEGVGVIATATLKYFDWTNL